MTDQPGSKPPPSRPSRIAAETPWYELFSRGARDWLRHNQKVREAVRGKLPELLTGGDLITRPENRTVLVPVKFLEHARFRLLDPGAQGGAGQGKGEAGQVLQPGSDESDKAQGGAGTEDGEVRFVLELKVDEIVDWLWEELKLPDLKPKRSASLDDPDYVREGWDKRGAHSRLDRRRTVREAVKRRAMQEAPIPFVNEDLRFRQLVRRATPALNAAVIFALDVSGSMQEAERKLAKTFFFFALQGIRRQYPKVETVFLAHTVDAWEFQEEQFFQVAGGGGTVASSVLRLSKDMLEKRFDPSRYNAYLFYASDGENASEDREAAGALLEELAGKINFTGYVQTDGSAYRPSETQMIELFRALQDKGLAAASARLASMDDVWNAIREFFSEEAQEAA
jgi:uncharacterized sporulation protein YeaH/YhbH (DUF444 family)